MRARGPLLALVIGGALLVGYALFRAQGTSPKSAAAPAPRPVPEPPTHTTFTTVQRPSGARAQTAPEAPKLQTAAERLVETLETSRDASAIEAALRAVLSTYSSRSTLKASPDAKLDHALIKHLHSGSPVVFKAALEAARIPLMTDDGPSPELKQAILEFAAPESPPAKRKLALEALNLIRPSRLDEAVLSSFEHALAAPEPELVSEALAALAQSGPALTTLSAESRARLTQRTLELTRHANPGVRGRALAVFASIPDLISAAERFQAGARALTDPNGYVRGEAANLLSRAADPKAIHALMGSVSDLSPAEYEIAFTGLEGLRAAVLHTVPGRKRVADAALFAILSLSKRLPLSRPLVLTLGGRAEPDAKVMENAALARTWYGAVTGEIPP